MFLNITNFEKKIKKINEKYGKKNWSYIDVTSMQEWGTNNVLCKFQEENEQNIHSIMQNAHFSMKFRYK